jgi:membrane-associated protein
VFSFIGNSIVSWLTGLPPSLVYVVVAALVFGEAAVFLGFILPGETAVLIGGFIASQGKVDVVALCVIVVVAAIVGDTVGYVVGARYGTRILERPILQRRRAGIDVALRGIERRGATYVFLGRFTAFFRAVVPGLAGMSKMNYPRFLGANACGGLLWGVGFTLLGYFAGHAYKRIETYSDYVGYALIAIVAVALVVMSVRRRRRERRVEASFAASHPVPPAAPGDDAASSD